MEVIAAKKLPQNIIDLSLLIKHLPASYMDLRFNKIQLINKID